VALIEQTLFDGEGDKVKIAIERLKAFEPPEGYYLAFSGGKDSVVIYHLAKMAGVKFDSHYSVTTIDPPDLIYFIREHHPDVKFDHPKVPFLVEMVKRGFPQRQRRWCCAVYKERGGGGRMVVTGVRAEESARRAKRKMVEHCMRDSTKRYIHAIFDWTSVEVWEFIKKYKVPYCGLYDKGYKRLGCLFCPMAYKTYRNLDRKLYPRFEEMYRRAFRKMYLKKKSEGKTSVDRWKDGDDMFDWWITETRGKAQPDQYVIFE